ncbi:rho-related GTP-binding protein RhoN-like [Chrysoperla carnea]|uniref:rho-related GTP-binding protein RhoN-like n=1 Tax=Chrysoperla carnea TaxID=189513 RepID=UPI001D07D0BE|nr:rho-related GTP-binding protein RhoN-like [Chrysoperla carnea]
MVDPANIDDVGGGGGIDITQSVAQDCKVVVCGDARCGKTSLIQRFITDEFNEVYTPTSFDKYATTYNVGDHRIRYSIWDTSGAQAYDTVRPLAYQDTSVFLLCFHVGEPQTLDNVVQKWYPEIRAHSDTAPIILCGCQVDLRHDIETISSLACNRLIPVTSEQAIAVSRQIGAATYVETSAKTSNRGVRDGLEVAALAALGKLNKHALRHRALTTKANKTNNKHDFKAELKGRAKSCCIM